MANVWTLQSTSLPNGATSIPATALPGFTTANTLSILIGQAVGANALTWAKPATSVVIALEVSYDGGNTWLGGGGTEHIGAPGSKLAAAAQFGGTFGYGNDVPTHVRGTITITNGPLTLSGAITVN